jgi:serine/threonine-protein kinase RsbT
MAPPGSDGLSIESESDVVGARRAVRDAAIQLGFGQTDVTRIVTAASELARNTFKYGGGGIMRCRRIQIGERSGIELQFVDHGPGIPDVSLALENGFSTSGGLGLGLPGAKRLMDDMNIESQPGTLTVVTVRKWLRH